MSQSRSDDQFRHAALRPDELACLLSATAGRAVPVCGASVTPVGHDEGSPATGGLWRVDVRGLQDEVPATTSFFVKLLRHPRLWPGLRHLPDEQSRREFVASFPWRFELDMNECGIGSVLPPGMRMPVLHRVHRADADHAALWFEYITQRPGGWRLADYRLAAFLLGRMAARRRAGAQVNTLLPPVARDGRPCASLRSYVTQRVRRGALPPLRSAQFWEHPVVAGALRRAADPGLPADLLALAGRLPALLDLLDSLPQAHAHGDASPQNLLLPSGEPGTVVVIDWGFGGLLPVGFDLGQLLVGLAHAGETDPAELADIDAAIFPAYLDGLAAEDYGVRADLVRAGYLGSLAARSALCALPFELLPGAQPTEQAEELFLRRLRLTRVMVDLAAETPVALAPLPAGN